MNRIFFYYVRGTVATGEAETSILEIAKAGVVWVPGAADKLRRGYSVQILPNLAKWLRAYPFSPYNVIPQFWSRRLADVFRAAEQPFLPNGFRKSFAAYLLAKTNDAAYVASQMGQWGIEALLGHYRRATTPKLAAEYFSICPKSARRK